MSGGKDYWQQGMFPSFYPPMHKSTPEERHLVDGFERSKSTWHVARYVLRHFLLLALSVFLFFGTVRILRLLGIVLLCRNDAFFALRGTNRATRY